MTGLRGCAAARMAAKLKNDTKKAHPEKMTF